MDVKEEKTIVNQEMSVVEEDNPVVDDTVVGLFISPCFLHLV